MFFKKTLIINSYDYYEGGRVMVIVVNAIFNNISVILLRSVLLVEETGVSGENHKPASSHWQTLSHNVVSSIPRLSGFWTQNVSGDMHRLHNHTITTNDGSNIKTLSNSWLTSYNKNIPFLLILLIPSPHIEYWIPFGWLTTYILNKIKKIFESLKTKSNSYFTRNDQK